MGQILKKQILYSEIRLIITVILCNIVLESHAQNKNIPPPKDVRKEVSFYSSLIKIDTIFIKELNKILFNVNSDNYDGITSIPKKYRNFILAFKEKDTLNYEIDIYIDSNPCKSALGFFEYTTGYYWVMNGIIPNNIIESISNYKKHFSYIEIIYAISPIDEGPKYWILLYNVSTKTFKVLETNVYY